MNRRTNRHILILDTYRLPCGKFVVPHRAPHEGETAVSYQNGVRTEHRQDDPPKEMSYIKKCFMLLFFNSKRFSSTLFFPPRDVEVDENHPRGIWESAFLLILSFLAGAVFFLAGGFAVCLLVAIFLIKPLLVLALLALPTGFYFLHRHLTKTNNT